jgi:hypothetical protein
MKRSSPRLSPRSRMKVEQMIETLERQLRMERLRDEVPDIPPFRTVEYTMPVVPYTPWEGAPDVLRQADASPSFSAAVRMATIRRSRRR